MFLDLLFPLNKYFTEIFLNFSWCCRPSYLVNARYCVAVLAGAHKSGEKGAWRQK